MSKVENLEKQIQQLSPEELAEFRRWYAEFDADLWDRQFESDVKAGKLDALAETALRAHAAGESTKL
jgi:succinate dehydrogenase flavin-adding protein (antitoxin of CptAB toxin-antitoxin module)